ncbi:EVE domain-containing protein [candidate division GN15 bacterium]|nr:EVE domain-containing protein [candidate division GN15 bacterium]
MAKRYWLFKSEPDCFSIDDLKREGTSHWDGVRNYQARNMLRDDIKRGDGVLFYHSGVQPPGVVGLAEVAKSGYPDYTAWDPESEHFDPKASEYNPIWYMVDVRFVRKLPEMLPLPQLKKEPGLENMMVTQRGSRLSVQPVTTDEWKVMQRMIKRLR